MCKPPAGGFFIRVDGLHYAITHTMSASGTKRIFLLSQKSAMNEEWTLDQDRKGACVVSGHIFIYFYHTVGNKRKCHAPIPALPGDYASG